MKARIIALALVSLSLTLVATAQEQNQGSFQGPNQVGSVDNQGIRNYLLGPGDLIDVRVFGQPDLNAIAEVDSEGNVSSLPFLETPIRARCRTEKGQKDIAAAYSKYLR